MGPSKKIFKKIAKIHFNTVLATLEGVTVHSPINRQNRQKSNNLIFFKNINHGPNPNPSHQPMSIIRHQTFRKISAKKERKKGFKKRKVTFHPDTFAR